MNELKILLIGCGKMGSSLLEGIVKSDNFDGMVDVIEPVIPVSYTHLRAHETPEQRLCRRVREKK